LGPGGGAIKSGRKPARPRGRSRPPPKPRKRAAQGGPGGAPTAQGTRPKGGRATDPPRGSPHRTEGGATRPGPERAPAEPPSPARRRTSGRAEEPGGRAEGRPRPLCRGREAGGGRGGPKRPRPGVGAPGQVGTRSGHKGRRRPQMRGHYDDGAADGQPRITTEGLGRDSSSPSWAGGWPFMGRRGPGPGPCRSAAGFAALRRVREACAVRRSGFAFGLRDLPPLDFGTQIGERAEPPYRREAARRRRGRSPVRDQRHAEAPARRVRAFLARRASARGRRWRERARA